jgi:hypothetical protein
MNFIFSYIISSFGISCAISSFVTLSEVSFGISSLPTLSSKTFLIVSILDSN